MKNVKKLNLNELKVESFVTSLDSKDAQTVKAGSSQVCGAVVGGVVSFVAAVVFMNEMDKKDKKFVNGLEKK